MRGCVCFFFRCEQEDTRGRVISRDTMPMPSSEQSQQWEHEVASAIHVELCLVLAGFVLVPHCHWS